MNTLDEIEIFIKNKAKEYAQEEDEALYDTIELDTFCKIVRFGIAEGLKINGYDLDLFVNNNYDEEISIWDYYYKILEKMKIMLENNELPAGTGKLYKIWLKEFWPEFYFDLEV